MKEKTQESTPKKPVKRKHDSIVIHAIIRHENDIVNRLLSNVSPIYPISNARFEIKRIDINLLPAFEEHLILLTEVETMIKTLNSVSLPLVQHDTIIEIKRKRQYKIDRFHYVQYPNHGKIVMNVFLYPSK